MQALRRARTLLLGSACVLTAVGIVMIYSASAIYAFDRMGDSAYFLKRHLLYVALASALGFAAYTADLVQLRKYSKRLLISVLVLMVLVLIPHVGTATGGARRWFKLFGFSLQPSEFLKIALVLYLADFWTVREKVFRIFATRYCRPCACWDCVRDWCSFSRIWVAR